MTTPASPNSISMTQIQTEFGGIDPISLSEYYAGGLYVSGAIAGVPTSSTISMDNLRGKTATTFGTLVANYSSRAEGSAVSFTLSGGSGIADGTYYWRLEGTGITAPQDFASLTGSFTITSNTGTITVTPLSDGVIEGTESFRMVLGDVSGVPVVAVASDYVSITETQTYGVTPTTTSVNEGSPVTFNVATTNVANGTVLYYSISAVTGTINTSDFTDSLLTGSFTISANAGSITKTLHNDTTTEGAESFRLYVRTGSTSGAIVATSATVSIGDTSLNPPTYALSWSPSTISEGGATTLTLSTTNVPNGTSLYWTLTGTGTYDDIALLTGSTGVTTTTNNSTSGIWYAAFDALTESSQTIIISYRATTGTAGAVLCAATLTINQLLGTVTTMTAAKSGGTSLGTSTTITMQIQSIPAYPVARTFSVTRSVNGGAYDTTGLVTTTMTVAANATSSNAITLYYVASSTGMATSLTFKATCPGHNDKLSNTFTNIYL